MISEYQDMLAKAKFYKKKVLQSFIKQGYYPSDEEIQAALSDIDTRSALLETYLSAKGSLFNTKEINYMFECIYKDLNILYEVLNEILINQYNKLKLDIEARLIEMEQKANNLKKRMDEEVNSTVLGTTIFFKSNQWEPETNDDITIIPLTQMNLINGSRIALFANINNINANSVYFQFDAMDDSNTSFFGLPYNFNMAPNHTNFALNDGVITSTKTITKVFIDAPAGFVCNFGMEKGEVWAICIDALIKNNKTILYTGDWSLRDFLILELVKSNVTKYKISLILKSNDNIVDYIDSVYIKEVD